MRLTPNHVSYCGGADRTEHNTTKQKKKQKKKHKQNPFNNIKSYHQRRENLEREKTAIMIEEKKERIQGGKEEKKTGEGEQGILRDGERK